MDESNKEERAAFTEQPAPTIPPPVSPVTEPPPSTGALPLPTKEERTWATIAHLSAFAMYFSGVGHILGPLIVWLAKRDGMPFVDDQAKEALNFQISFTIYVAAAIAVCFTLIGVVIGIPILCVLPVFHIVCMIIAAIKASDGVAYRYPLTLRLIK